MNASRFRQVNLGLIFLVITVSLVAWPYLPATFRFSGYCLAGRARLLWFATPVAILVWNVTLMWAFDTYSSRNQASNSLFSNFFEWCLLVSGTIPAAFFQMILFAKSVTPDLFHASGIFWISIVLAYVAYLFRQLFLYAKKMKQPKIR